ncbi:MAG: hypothetical protein P8Y75_08075 [Nitrospirota bacterium]|jgi:hypothetical protein
MKKLSLKGLAEYMTATDSHKRKMLRDYKYPSVEALAKITYYREARDRIAAFHSGGHDTGWLLDAAADLDVLVQSSDGTRKTRFKYNARALRGYAKHFGKKKFKVLGETTYGLHFDDVLITVHPDLHVEEKGKEKLIKLEFGLKEPDSRKVKIINQCMLEAVLRDRLDIASSGVLYFDVPRGRIHKGARIGSRMTNDIDAACKNISAIWDNI